MVLTDEQVRQVLYVVNFNTHGLEDKDDIRQFFWIRFMPQVNNDRWNKGRGKITTFARAVVRSAIQDFRRINQRDGFVFTRKGGEQQIPERVKYGRILPAGAATPFEDYIDRILPKSEERRKSTVSTVY